MLIKPIATRNGISFAILSSILIILGLIFLLTSPDQPLPLTILGALLLITGLVFAITAFAKLKDVDYRFSLTQDGIHYFTTRGGFTILWQDIQRIDIPKLNQGFEVTELPYIGIRLKQYENFINTASLPVLSHMLIEQRALTLLTDTPSSAFGRADNMLYPNTSTKNKFKGLQAMFVDRMTFLHHSLGYDIFLPLDDLDRDPLVFVQLLSNLKQKHMTDQYKQE